MNFALAPTPTTLTAGMKRIFSRDALMQSLKALAKLAAIAWVAWATLAPRVGDFARLAGAPASSAFAFTAGLALRLAVRVAILYVVIGAADYLWQRRSHRKKLMMTREEVKREYKESEGDPRHKAERQRMHRDLLRHDELPSGLSHGRGASRCCLRTTVAD